MNAKTYEKVRKSNIKEDSSFNSVSESIQKTLNHPNSVFMYIKLVVENLEENDCKVNNFHK